MLMVIEPVPPISPLSVPLERLSCSLLLLIVMRLVMLGLAERGVP